MNTAHKFWCYALHVDVNDRTANLGRYIDPSDSNPSSNHQY
jgi:hypothetical protein